MIALHCIHCGGNCLSGRCASQLAAERDSLATEMRRLHERATWRVATYASGWTADEWDAFVEEMLQTIADAVEIEASE